MDYGLSSYLLYCQYDDNDELYCALVLFARGGLKGAVTMTAERWSWQERLDQLEHKVKLLKRALIVTAAVTIYVSIALFVLYQQMEAVSDIGYQVSRVQSVVDVHIPEEIRDKEAITIMWTKVPWYRPDFWEAMRH
jgi:hypothetical protein